MKLLIFTYFALFSFSANAYLVASPSSVNFYGTPVNSYGDQRTVQVSNYGNAEVRLSIYESCSFDFSIRESFCYSLLPSSSCQINIRFSPSREGYQSCSLRISSNEYAYSETVQISGQGVQQDLEN